MSHIVKSFATKYLLFQFILICGLNIFSCTNNNRTNSEISTTKEPVIVKPKKDEIYTVVIESKTQLSEEPYVYDTINEHILRRIDNYRMYDGSIKDYVYVNNEIVAYGTKEKWENLSEISANEFSRYSEQKLDSFDLPKKENGVLKLDTDFILHDDTDEMNYQVFDVFSYFFERRFIVFTKLSLHRTTYYAYDFELGRCDTLLGKPHQLDSYLSCFDDERVTDSPHLYKLFQFNDGLDLISEFSISYLFRIEPEEVVLINDSTLNIRNAGIYSEPKYWRFTFR